MSRAQASIRGGMYEVVQGTVNMVRTIVRTAIIMLAAIGLYFLLGTTDVIDHLQMNKPPIYEFGN